MQVNEDLDLPSGVDPQNVVVAVYLAGEGGAAVSEAYAGGQTIIASHQPTVAADGTWSEDLTPNEDITPSGTVWARTWSTGGQSNTTFATIPATGGPFLWKDRLTDPPGALTPAALTVHEAKLADDVHGVVEHNWGRHTWADFTVIVRTPDPEAEWDRTVDDGKGVVTAVQAAGGESLRTAAVRSGTGWADAEIRSLILPPSKWLGTNTQMGHTHRFREISPGVHEAINIWTSIVFGGDYGTLHVAAVRNDGVNPTLQSAVANDTGNENASIDRRSAVRAHTRFNFGADFNTYRVVATRGLLDTLAAGDLVTIDELADATFNETAVALNGNPDRLAEQVTVADPAETAPVAWTHDFTGRVTPSGTSAQKRWAPFHLATRVVGGDVNSVPVEIKRWRKGEPEPGWDDARVRRVDVVPDGDVPAMPLGPGLHGILDAHLHSDTSHFWGDLQFRRL